MSHKARKIAALNDAFRASGQGGHIVSTIGIQALPEESQQAIFNLVRTFNAFSEDNDPYGEHDFGSVEYADEKIFWKIDYYNQNMSAGSEDPSDPSQTTRVMTIMLANEY